MTNPDDIYAGADPAASDLPPEIVRRAHWLRRELARHDRLYYVEAAPEIGDREYDRLYRELCDLEQAYPVLATPDSPTCRVGGAPLKEFRQVRHGRPMLSLANTYSRDELLDFTRRVRKRLGDRPPAFVLEPKIDGVAVALRYEDGVMTLGCSRGNGEIGDDITANLRVIRNIPLRLALPQPPPALEVRGEIFMPRDAFPKLNRERTASGEPPFANPRNAAAGSLKLLDPALVARRRLAAVFYALTDTASVGLTDHCAVLDFLRQAGLPVPPRWWLCHDEDAVMQALDELRAARAGFAFDTDGAVLKLNQCNWYDELGVTAKSPRWAAAYKFAPEQAVTRLVNITVQVGRTGALTPVAELEPVALAGSTVNRATLHNADEIRRRDIRIGDLVTVEKAGEIIPAVVASNPAARSGAEREFVMPGQCPACGGVTVRRDGETAWRCENMQCPAQIKRWIMHFASRNAMDVANLGEALVEQLVDRGLVADPAGLFALSPAALAALDRMAAKSADNLVRGIDAARRRPFTNLIFALGIRHVGLGTARLLARHFEDIDSLMQAPLERLAAIDDIGPVVARSIVDFFAMPRSRALIENLAQAGVNLRRLPDELSAARQLAGYTFVLTGAMSAMTRTQAETEIIRRGGRVSNNVSAKTTFVVAGRDAGSKLDRARRLGVRILSEPEFADVLSAAPPADAAPPAGESAAESPPLPVQGELSL